jgi:hypothetical protein
MRWPACALRLSQEFAAAAAQEFAAADAAKTAPEFMKTEYYITDGTLLF